MRIIRRFRRAALLIAVLAGSRVGAQQPATSAAGRAPGSVGGSVVDATTGAPLERALVTLAPMDGFGVLSEARSALSAYSISRTTKTGTTGTYRFTNLSPGDYRLYIQRIGYQPTTVDVRLGAMAASQLSVGLVVVPVRLRAMDVRASDVASFAAVRPGRAMSDDARIDAARARQREFLSTDVRELTSTDVAESATLGATDVFRSMQRLPGVTQFDDWSAKIWVRGNRWDHSRVYYDDLPLFEPLQALGQLSGVSADAIGGAFLHPGVRPVSIAGDGAARIDLRSRPAGGGGDLRGTVEASQFGVSTSLEQRRKDGRAAWLVSAHRSISEILPGHLPWFGDAFSGDFSDLELTARTDFDLGGGRRLEASGLLGRDRRRIAPLVGPNSETQTWGNRSGRISFHAPLGAFQTSHTIGMTSFASTAQRPTQRFVDESSNPFVGVVPVYAPVDARVRYFTFGGKIGDKPMASGDAWAAGYDGVAQQSSFAGRREAVYWGDLSDIDVSRRNALSYVSVWTERRWTPVDRLTVEAGLRFDAGASHGLDAARPAPSLQARYALTPVTNISAGVGRTHQYVQGLDLPVFGQGQTTPGIWVTSGDDVPMMSVDNAMIGVEHWLNGSMILAANAYARRSAGAIVADPRPGVLTDRPLFVSASEAARGLELSARRLNGRVTGLLAYSYGHATTRAAGLSYTAPADRTHAVDAMAMVRLGHFRVGAAYAFTSGTPFTRLWRGTLSENIDNPAWTTPPSREAPNARRTPVYSSTDVLVDYTRDISGLSLTGYAGVQNIIGRRNQTWYVISGVCGNGDQLWTDEACRGNDWFAAPVQFAPTLGLRIAF